MTSWCMTQSSRIEEVAVGLEGGFISGRSIEGEERAQPDQECFVRFIDGVAVDEVGDRQAGDAGRKGKRARGRHVVVV